MNICLFGGAFDPIHRGHLAAARAAVSRFKLDRVLFVPSPAPPHKPCYEALAPFADRYAMVALATSAVKKFIPSDIEFQRAREGRSALPSYSIDTVRNFRRGMSKSDSLFFLLGMDAFLGIATRRQPRRPAAGRASSSSPPAPAIPCAAGGKRSLRICCLPA